MDPPRCPDRGDGLLRYVIHPKGHPVPSKAAAQEVTRSATIGVVVREYRDGRFDSFLSRVDPLTLRPRGRRADVGEFHDTWSLSPDGTKVALGQGGEGLGIRIYDVVRMKRVQAVQTGIATQALAWLKPNRLVGVTQGREIVVADPTTGKVLRRSSLGSSERVCYGGPTFSGAAAGRLFLMLRAAKDAAPRALLVGAEGVIRAATLPKGRLWGCGRSGLALDPAHDRAFVVSRGSLVAEVDLATMSVRYHRVTGETLRDALPRVAQLADDRHLVVSGRDAAGRPADVSVIDTTTWTNRIIDPRGGTAQAVAGVILSYDGDAVALKRGRGVAGYSPDGGVLFRALRGRQIGYLAQAGTHAYAFDERDVRAVDVTTGRVIGKDRARAARVRVTIIK